MIKCQQDPEYFLTKLHQGYLSLDDGIVPSIHIHFQQKLIESFHNRRFTICKLPRQSGKSVTVTAYLIHQAIFRDNINVAILANKRETAFELMAKLQTSYENLPKWLQQGVLAWNKGSIELENGSRITASHQLPAPPFVDFPTTLLCWTSLHSSQPTSPTNSLALYILLSLLVNPPR